ncbi:MAG TPA: hypothetical protein VNJ08_07560 [Bacteriovoracaceae bacterium]|nr:hypothetical protein [Bacteriovoracaceae bacterium]
MLCLVLFSIEARASEFSHLKLNPQFEQFLTGPKERPIRNKSLSPFGAKAINDSDAPYNIVAEKFRSSVF